MNPQLQTAIENVYAAFKDIPKPKFVDGCPCCIDQKGISILLAKPLRELSPDDLTHYAASVFLTVGSVEDFSYFLPRILEICVTKTHWWPDPEVIAGALLNSEFHSWPKTRSKAGKDFLNAVIDDLVADDDKGFELDSWICALAKLKFDLNPYLKKIASNKPCLISYYEVNSQQLLENHLANSFWNDAQKEHRQVVDWFQSAEIKKAIELAYGLA
jgi:hypothetical protein